MATRGLNTDQHIDYCTNVNQTQILILEDRLENILLKNEKVLKSKLSWTTPIGLFLTGLVALLTSDFKDWIWKKEYWFAIFLLGAIASFIWLVITIVIAIKNRKKGSISEIIKEIKNAN